MLYAVKREKVTCKYKGPELNSANPEVLGPDGYMEPVEQPGTLDSATRDLRIRHQKGGTVKFRPTECLTPSFSLVIHVLDETDMERTRHQMFRTYTP